MDRAQNSANFDTKIKLIDQAAIEQSSKEYLMLPTGFEPTTKLFEANALTTRPRRQKHFARFESYIYTTRLWVGSPLKPGLEPMPKIFRGERLNHSATRAQIQIASLGELLAKLLELHLVSLLEIEKV